MMKKLLLLFALTALNGCIPYYIPMPEHGLASGRAMVSEQQLRSIKPGVDTREDILMRFGDPSNVYDGELIFVYNWERFTGVWGYATAFGGGEDYGVSEHQYFIVAFDENAFVLQAGLVDPFVWQSSEKQLEEILEEWRSGGSETQ
jgi:outer membrane protein assembly factor BamE (lipoprotein component of BamABCDE complex)